MKNITPHNETSRAVASLWLPLASKVFSNSLGTERRLTHFCCCIDPIFYKKGKGNANDQLNFENHQMDVCDLTRSHSRGRSQVHDEQGRSCDQARLHQPEFSSPSHDWSLKATKEKVNPNGFQKSTPINQSPSAATQSRAAVLGLFYFQKT